MEHTKGEWEIQYAACPVIVSIDGEDSIDIARLDLVPNGNTEVEANARLIAAAPDLLGACKAVRIELKLLRGLAEFEADICIATVQERINQINFAIAKAEKS